MILSENNINFFLFEKGITDWETYQNLNFKIKSIGKRNLCFRFESKNIELFIKQTKYNDSQNRSLILKEFSFYNEVFKNNQLSAIKQYIPKFIYFCPINFVLVIEYFTKGKNLSDLFREKPDTYKYLKKISEILACLHKIKLRSDKENIYPWIFYIEQENVQQEVSFGRDDAKKNIELILRNPKTLTILKQITSIWEAKSITHQDIKFENILYSKKTKTFNIIDWESVVVGDGFWDLAGLLQATIFHYINRNKVIISNPSLPIHPILDYQELTFNLYSILYTYSSIWQLEDRNKIIQFTGCFILKKIIEMPFSFEEEILNHQFIAISNEMMLNPMIYSDLFDKQ